MHWLENQHNNVKVDLILFFLPQPLQEPVVSLLTSTTLPSIAQTPYILHLQGLPSHRYLITIQEIFLSVQE